MTSIFIISQHRTGSTLLKNMLDAHSNVTMAFDEMNLFEFRRSNSLDKLIHTEVNTPEELIKAIKEKKIYGTFWKDFQKSNIDLTELKNKLEQEEFNLKNILKSILSFLSLNNNTNYSGIKYPVHFSEGEVLKKWFPNSKIIFLTRNPKAIIASKLNDPATKKRKSKSLIHRFLIHYFTLIYFAFEYNKSEKFWSKNKSFLFKLTYEELVQNQNETLSKLCQFCNLEFEQEMCSVNGKESSYNHNTINEVVTKSLDKYKTILSTFDQWLIQIITNKSLKKLTK